MFSTEEKLKARMGKNNVGRYQYLKMLVEEFKTTKILDAKQQIMANLANFAYDPINYKHLRSLGIVDLFLVQLSEDDITLARFALGGLCNLALDPENKDHINTSGGIGQISNWLRSDCPEVLMYAVTTLMYLMTANYKHEITSDGNIGQILELSHHSDKRVQNLAIIFLEDYCSRDKVQKIQSSVSHIPLPTVTDTTTSQEPSTSQ